MTRTTLSIPRPWIGAATLCGLCALAYAAVPNTFAPGDKLSASELNENFAATASSVATLESSIESLEERLEAAEAKAVQDYCGVTLPTTMNLNGIANSALACSQVAECGPTAMVCDSSAIRRARVRGTVVPTGVVMGDGYSSERSCNEFTTNTSGLTLLFNGQVFTTTSCANLLPLLCCE